MRKFLRILLTVLFMVSAVHLISQPSGGILNGLPLKQIASPVFGYDIHINDQPDLDQRNVAIGSAFNGWLYAFHSYFDTVYYTMGGVGLRSKDNGENWAILIQSPFGFPDRKIEKTELIICGQQDTSNIRLVFGFLEFDTIAAGSSLSVGYFDKNFKLINPLFNDEPYYDVINDFAIATDDLNPALNSNPFSLGLIYSKTGTNKDSLIFLSSGNGGMSFNGRRKIPTSSRYLGKVALFYGYCPEYNSGRYFAVWEEKENKNDATGRIYTAHTDPYFNSPFTVPVRLDSIDPATADKASNPVIACQNISYNNDSANLTEIVMFETYNPSQNQHTISGVFNKKAVGSTSFLPFNIDGSENNILQPDLCFNPFDSTFIVTYFDSTALKLPYYTQNMNMINPDSWNSISSGYNDYGNIPDPHPQVCLDFGTHTGANAWVGTRVNGNGEALFDAPFIYYTGEKGKSKPYDKLNVRIFPNPAHESTTVEIDLPEQGEVEMQIFNSRGQSIEKQSFFGCHAGKNRITVDLTSYKSGIYIIQTSWGMSHTYIKLAVVDAD